VSALALGKPCQVFCFPEFSYGELAGYGRRLPRASFRVSVIGGGVFSALVNTNRMQSGKCNLAHQRILPKRGAI
jgi:hypothetical protein